MHDLPTRVLEGDLRAISRAITLVENRTARGPELVKALYRHTGKARVIGMTGSPGVGKSTLTNRLTALYRARGLKVGIIAVDPTSPFSGGAILGDRIRMMEHYTDDGVFIRSMATRGKLGGLAAATADAVDILDAAGYAVIIVETVGVGQDEIDVVRIAETSVVILVPGMGDEMQAIKAGIMEIADIFVVNKADTDGADRLMRELRALMAMAAEAPALEIVRTVATTGEGVDRLAEVLDQTRDAGGPDRVAKKHRELAEKRLLDVLEESFLALTRKRLTGSNKIEGMVDRIAARTLDPFSAAESILAEVVAAKE